MINIIGLVILLMPFNGFGGPSFLGELGLELSTFSIILFLVLCGIKYATMSVRLAVLFSLVIFLHFLLTVDTGEWSRIQFSRFATSWLVLIFYFSFSTLVSSLSYQIGFERFLEFLVRPIKLVAIFLSIFYIIEIISWYIPSIREVVLSISSLVTNRPWFSSGRLHGVAYEPSFNAIFLAGFIPLLAMIFARSEKAKFSLFQKLILLAFYLALIATNSRTGLTVAIYIAAHLTARSLLNSHAVRTAVIVSMVVFFPVVFWWVLSINSNNLLLSIESTSNITRISAVSNLISVWSTYPLAGIGFGQSPLMYAQNANSQFVLSSWEVYSYLYGERFGQASPMFSAHWRILADSGLIGFVLFYGFFAILILRLERINCFSSSVSIRKISSFLSLGLSTSLICGVSYDSFRMPVFWLLVGLSLSFYKEFRRSF